MVKNNLLAVAVEVAVPRRDRRSQRSQRKLHKSNHHQVCSIHLQLRRLLRLSHLKKCPWLQSLTYIQHLITAVEYPIPMMATGASKVIVEVHAETVRIAIHLRHLPLTMAAAHHLHRHQQQHCLQGMNINCKRLDWQDC